MLINKHLFIQSTKKKSSSNLFYKLFCVFPIKVIIFSGSPTSGDDAVSHVIYDEVMDEDASTQSSQPNDHQNLSSDSKSPSTCHHSPKIKSSSSSSINNKKFLPEGDNHPNPPRENSAKVRVSPKPRRSRVQQDKKSTTTEFENSNNSNTKPAVPIKPKAITDSFKQRKARFVTTVKGGLSTHSAISKKKQKVLRQVGSKKFVSKFVASFARSSVSSRITQLYCVGSAVSQSLLSASHSEAGSL